MFSKLSIIFTATSASSWDYLQNGADWPEFEVENNQCGLTNQSPINLISRDSSEFKYKVYDDDKDMLTK
jgi:hypothetical protein